MRTHSAGFATGAWLSLFVVALAAPATAQNFQNGSAVTIPSGNLRLTASPVHMFGRNGLPDSTGGAFRLGCGLTDSIDVEAKTGFFDGVDLVGADGHFNVLGGPTRLSSTVGGHRAIVSQGRDSNALDLAVQLSQRLRRGLEIYAGPAFSYESLSGGPEPGFTRWYLVPGLRAQIAERLDLVVEAGLGFNDNSPHYVTAGLAVLAPTSASARGRGR
jgi:hypothetical protein